MGNHGYGIQDFAALYGVTVKVLRHYEELGLLTPAKSAAGYRRYSQSDGARLERVKALKALGLSLRRVKAVLDAKDGQRALNEAIRLQRTAVLEKRRKLDRALRAIDSAVAAPRPIERIVDVMNSPWARIRVPESVAWRRLRGEIVQAAAQQEDLAGGHAQALAGRFLELWRSSVGERAADGGGDEDDALVLDFLRRTSESARRRYFETESTWNRFRERNRLGAADPHAASKFWQASADLFADTETALNQEEEEAGKRGGELRARWLSLIEDESGGDLEIRSALLHCWADRANWPAMLRWMMEGRFMMAGKRFDRVAEFLAQPQQ